MSYESSKFGDGSASGAGNVVTQVNNHYGSRDTGKTVGRMSTDGVMNEVVLDIDGETVSNQAYPLMAPKLPAGSRIEDVFVEVVEAFNLGGTTPAIEIGTATSEATDGVTVSEAEAEAVGVYDLTSALSGTWAAAGGFTSEVTLGLVMSGTSPTSANTGKMRVVIRYAKL